MDNLAGSNWKDAEGNTLVSAVVTEQKTSIREVSLKIVDAEENSITVTFKAKNVPTTVEMENILKPNVEPDNTVETNLENKGEVGQE